MKKCISCKETKPLAGFNKNKTKKGGLHTSCKKCSSAYCKQYYSKNREAQAKRTIARSRKQKIENRQFVFDYLSSNHCVDCGMSDPRALGFDHLRDKKYNLAKMIGAGFCIETIKEEIAKCEVRCANCHNIKTAIERNYYSNYLMTE